MINFNLKAFVVALIAAHAHCVHGAGAADFLGPVGDPTDPDASTEWFLGCVVDPTDPDARYPHVLNKALEEIEITILDKAYYVGELQPLTANGETKKWIARLKKSKLKQIHAHLKSFTGGKDGDYTDVLDALLLAVDADCSLKEIQRAFSRLISDGAEEDDKALVIYACSNALNKGTLEEVTSIVVESIIPLFKDGLTDLQRSEFMDVFVALLTAPNIDPFALDVRTFASDIISLIKQESTKGEKVDKILRLTKEMAVRIIEKHFGIDLSGELLTPSPRRKFPPVSGK